MLTLHQRAQRIFSALGTQTVTVRGIAAALILLPGLCMISCDGCDGGIGPTNEPPNAAFTSSCNRAGCSFTDQSSDPDGTVEDYERLLEEE